MSQMKTLETERLLLRAYQEEDFAAVHRYSAAVENVVYMAFGPNTEEETRAFLRMAMEAAEKVPCVNYQYGVVLKETGQIIGGSGLTLSSDKGEIGWILHRDYWKQGYGPEMGRALLGFGFDTLHLHRIYAVCDAENYGSYRVMEKIGMSREGLFVQGRPGNKLSTAKYGDELLYAMVREDWAVQKEMAYYNSLPVAFEGFMDIPALSDGTVYLVCTKKAPGNPEKKWVPGYTFAVCAAGEKVGEINLRIGYTDGLYYGGQIGYGIDEGHRGKGYAVRACRLLLPVAKAHGMVKLLITNDQGNTASRRVCEKLGARHIRLARLPQWHDLYKEGQRFSNIFEWSVT